MSTSIQPPRTLIPDEPKNFAGRATILRDLRRVCQPERRTKRLNRDVVKTRLVA